MVCAQREPAARGRYFYELVGLYLLARGRRRLTLVVLWQHKLPSPKMTLTRSVRWAIRSMT
jgi:hypothetical protein